MFKKAITISKHQSSGGVINFDLKLNVSGFGEENDLKMPTMRGEPHKDLPTDLR